MKNTADLKFLKNSLNYLSLSPKSHFFSSYSNDLSSKTPLAPPLLSLFFFSSSQTKWFRFILGYHFHLLSRKLTLTQFILLTYSIYIVVKTLMWPWTFFGKIKCQLFSKPTISELDFEELQFILPWYIFLKNLSFIYSFIHSLMCFLKNLFDDINEVFICKGTVSNVEKK